MVRCADELEAALAQKAQLYVGNLPGKCEHDQEPRLCELCHAQQAQPEVCSYCGENRPEKHTCLGPQPEPLTLPHAPGECAWCDWHR